MSKSYTTCIDARKKATKLLWEHPSTQIIQFIIKCTKEKSNTNLTIHYWDIRQVAECIHIPLYCRDRGREFEVIIPIVNENDKEYILKVTLEAIEENELIFNAWREPLN